MTNKYILVSGKSLYNYTNARVRVRAHPRASYRLTHLPLTTTREDLADLTSGQGCGRLLLQAHN